MRSILLALIALFFGTSGSWARSQQASWMSCRHTTDPSMCATVKVQTDISTLTCEQAQSIVNAEGAVVLSTGPYTYDRFVSEDIYCEPNGDAYPAFEKTRDNKQCMIGYYCKSKDVERDR